MTCLRATACALLLLGAAGVGTLAGQEHREGEYHQEGQACCGNMPQGEHPMHAMHMRAMGPMMRVAMFAPPHLLERREALELTDEQVSRLEGLGQGLMEQHDLAMVEAQEHHAQVMQLWGSEIPDVDQLRQHAQAAMRAHENAMLALLTVAAQAKAVLTPDQRERMAGMAHEHMQQMMHQGRPHMMPGEQEHMEEPQRQP